MYLQHNKNSNNKNNNNNNKINTKTPFAREGRGCRRSSKHRTLL
jgi:hypothetical protein